MGKHRLSLLFAVITAIAIGVATTIINDVMGELASVASEVAPQVDEARSAVLWTILATFGALFLLFLGFVAMADVTIYRSRKRELAAMEEAKHNLEDRVRERTQQLEVAQEELQQSELKYRTVVEQALDGILMIEPRSGCLIEVNPRIEELTGYSREQLLNMTLPLLHSEAEGTETMELLQRTLEHGRAATDHLAFQKRTGERIPIDLSCNLVEYQGGEVILGMVRDTTERKEVEERLQETSRLVSVGELAAGVAHEINNPLTVVIGYSELLMDKGLPEPIQSRVQRVFSEAQRAAKIVQNLLSFARRREPEKRYMDVTAILERALELKAYEFKVSNINVTSEWQPDLPRTMVDQHQLMQVILNLLTNAEQAMIDAKGGGELLIRTTRRGDQDYDERGRRWAWNPAGVCTQDLRSIFHHEGGGEGDRPWPQHMLWHSPPAWR